MCCAGCTGSCSASAGQKHCKNMNNITYQRISLKNTSTDKQGFWSSICDSQRIANTLKERTVTHWSQQELHNKQKSCNSNVTRIGKTTIEHYREDRSQQRLGKQTTVVRVPLSSKGRHMKTLQPRVSYDQQRQRKQDDNTNLQLRSEAGLHKRV